MTPPPLRKLSGGKTKVVVSKVRKIQQKEYFFIMKLLPKSKRSTNVAETLFPYFLHCRQLFKEQVQSFIHYKKELFIFILELVFSIKGAIRA